MWKINMLSNKHARQERTRLSLQFHAWFIKQNYIAYWVVQLVHVHLRIFRSVLVCWLWTRDETCSETNWDFETKRPPNTNGSCKMLKAAPYIYIYTTFQKFDFSQKLLARTFFVVLISLIYMIIMGICLCYWWTR